MAANNGIKSLRIVCALAAESAFFKLVAHRKDVVRCFENSVCDGALLLDDEDNLSEDSTTRTLTMAAATLEDIKTTRCLTFDFKRTSPHEMESRHCLHYRVASEEHQRAATSFYILELAGQDVFVVLPVGLQLRVSIPISCTRSNPALHHSWQPYAFSPREIDTVLDQLKRSANENTPFVLPQWGVPVDWIPRLRPPPRACRLQMVPVRRIMRIRQKLEAFSTGISLRLSEAAPLLADVVFEFLVAGRLQTAHVELKSGYIVERDSGRRLSLYLISGTKDRCLFRVQSAWHYILLDVNSSEPTLSLFLPRQCVPLEWWATEDSTRSFPSGRVRINTEDFEEFILHDNDRRWASRLYQIMLKYPPVADPTSSVIVPKPIIVNKQNKFLVRQVDENFEVASDDSSEPLSDSEIPNNSQDGSDLSGEETSEDRQATAGNSNALALYLDLLNSVCCRKGLGVFLFCGRDEPSGRCFFIRHKWTNSEKDAFTKHGQLPVKSTSISSHTVGVWTIVYGCKIPNMLWPTVRFTHRFSKLALARIKEDPPKVLVMADFGPDEEEQPRNFGLYLSEMLGVQYDTKVVLGQPKPREIRLYSRESPEGVVNTLLGILSDKVTKESPKMSFGWSDIEFDASKYRRFFKDGMVKVANENLRKRPSKYV